MTEVARLVPGPHPGITRTIPVPPAPVAFGFGGGRAALGYADGRLRVLDLGTGAMLIDVQSEAAPVQVVALSGRWLVAGVGDRIEVWDTITSNRLVVHPPHPDQILALSIEPERKWVASVDRRSPGVRVADLRTGVELGVVGRIYRVPGWSPSSGLQEPPGEPPEERELALRTALAAFAAFRIMHADVGAADDVVEQTLHEIVRAAWQGAADLVPLGVAGWELAPGPVAQVAAERLDGAAALVDAAVRAIPPEERDQMQALVQGEAWRVDLERMEGDVGCHAVGWLSEGHLVVEHDDGVGIWDLAPWSSDPPEEAIAEQVAAMAGHLLAVEGDQVLIVDRETAEVRSWQVFTGLVRSEPLPPGRLIPSQDSVDEVVVADDAALTLVRFGQPPRRIEAGIGRLGTVVARLGEEVVAASLATVRICPLDRLEVDDPRAGLPIVALAVHPEGRSVAVVRAIDDHDEMRVEVWTPPDPVMKVLPGALPLVGAVGIGPSGRIRAASSLAWASAGPPVTVRVWGPDGEEQPLDEVWQGGVLAGRWVHAGDLLRDLESDEVRHGPPPAADRAVVVRRDDLVVVGGDGLVVLAHDGVTVGHTERWPLRPVRSAHALHDGAVLIVFADGGVAGWSDLTGVVEPWFVPPVVDVAVTGDGRIAFGVVDQGPQEAARAWVELWDGVLRDPVRSGMWPASGAGVVVAAAGTFLAYGDPTGQIVLIDLRDE